MVKTRNASTLDNQSFVESKYDVSYFYYTNVILS